MGEFAAVLKAIADLAWAALAGAVFWSYRSEIRRLLSRAKKLEIGSEGVKVELDELQQAAEAAKQLPTIIDVEVQPRDLKALPPASETISPPPVQATSPKYAVVLLAADIERELRHYVAVTGRLHGRNFLALPREAEKAGLPVDLALAIRRFWDVRNKVVHGMAASDDDAARAADSGFSILASLRALPRERNFIYHPGVQLFSDSACMIPIATGLGLVLETTASDGKTKSLRIYPTTKTDYVKGSEVAWEWSNRNLWGEAWYRHPDTGQVAYAWTSSMEFVGRPLADL